jgi:hypothetical protein
MGAPTREAAGMPLRQHGEVGICTASVAFDQEP